jgi:hypothetical protein
MTTRSSREDDAIVRENAPNRVRFNYQLRIVAVPFFVTAVLVTLCGPDGHGNRD